MYCDVFSNYCLVQSLSNLKKFGFQIRAKTTSSTLKKTSGEVQLDATHCEQDVVTTHDQDEQTSPVCSYNEWDPLEVATM